MRSVAPAAPPPARSSPRSAPTWVASPPPAIWPPGPASPRGQTIGGQDQGQQLHRPRQPVSGPGARGGRRGGRPDRHLPGERYRRIARRRDTKRAIVAVGRSILVIIWHLLADPDARFHDLGAGFYDTRINPERAKRNHIRQLEALGYKVTLQPAA